MLVLRGRRAVHLLLLRIDPQPVLMLFVRALGLSGVVVKLVLLLLLLSMLLVRRPRLLLLLLLLL